MDNKVLQAANELRNELAGDSLSPRIAKLYSQHTRLISGQPGLSGWRKDEAIARFNDVVKLTEAGFIFLDNKQIDLSQDSFKRAAEITEWLDHQNILDVPVNLSVISSSLYQLAGLPARAVSMIKRDTNESVTSQIFRSFIGGDFRNLVKLLPQFWNDECKDELKNDLMIREVIRSIGIIAAQVRWGEQDSRFEVARQKLYSFSKILAYSNNFYLWFVSRAAWHVSSLYEEKSIRRGLDMLREQLTSNGSEIIEKYVRKGFQEGKHLIWPSQQVGIERLIQNNSFVLCTPTGSGKTTIAEVAIIKSLFEGASAESAPLVLYITPSKALATEVESKFSRLFKKFGEKIIVTGLYGGTDWGPTDAWLTSTDRTILICTFEKAEALLRFLGPLFITRISLVVVDEAHSVQFDAVGIEEVADSRPLRLEVLITRLLSYIDTKKVKIIGLSAVAAQIEKPLACWLESKQEAMPVKTSYRSTRQLLGRLEVSQTGNFMIRYDLLDSNKLQFDGKDLNEGPYVLNPIPKDPTPGDWKTGEDETILRSALFWAAIHFASGGDKSGRSVLISIPQLIGGYAEDLITLFEKYWDKESIPTFFSEPTTPYEKSIFDKTLASCEDYFGKSSREYRLLTRGIVVHHGKMPGIMARLLVQLIELKIVNIVMATSTLSEGVNLPFELVLLPTIKRGRDPIPAREFSNLMGRAGRPGMTTEGTTLVIMPKDNKYLQRQYAELLNQLALKSALPVADQSFSPLQSLIALIYQKWAVLNPNQTPQNFILWLETTQPEVDDLKLNSKQDDNSVLNQGLDSLDGFLINSLVELEKLLDRDLTEEEWINNLKKIWTKSFAYYSLIQSSSFETILVTRGKALKSNIYSDKKERSRIYKSSLNPGSAKKVFDILDEIKKHLSSGASYFEWSTEEKFDYVLKLTQIMDQHPKFRVSPKVGRSKKIKPEEVLRWWLDPKGAKLQPTSKQVTDWFNFISSNFQYKFNWGLGSVLSLILDEVHHGELRETKLDDWPLTGMPWIVFWLKELISWGTLDPVVAFLLARGNFTTRSQAELKASDYYIENAILSFISSDSIYDAKKIRDWSLVNMEKEAEIPEFKNLKDYDVRLLRDFKGKESDSFRVLPIMLGKKVVWMDFAGFQLGDSDWDLSPVTTQLNTYDFVLYPANKKVMVKKFMDIGRF